MSSKNRKLSDEQISRILDEYRQGDTAKVLAERYGGCSLATIYNVLERHGVRRRSMTEAKRRLSPEQERAMLDAYRADEPMSEILQRFGCTQSAFYQVRNRYGVPAREREWRSRLFSPDQERAIAAEYQGGSSLSDLARQYGTHLETIRKLLRRRGVQRRPRGNSARQFSPEEVAAFSERWAAGESQHTIGKSIGLTQVQVSRLLRDIGQPPEVRIPRGEKHNNWKGGRAQVGNGYTAIRVEADDPLRTMAHSGGYVLEHRLVMARAIGRPLSRTETVHHINGDRTDNRPENLQLRNGRHGNGVVLACADCGSHNVMTVPIAE